MSIVLFENCFPIPIHNVLFITNPTLFIAFQLINTLILAKFIAYLNKSFMNTKQPEIRFSYLQLTFRTALKTYN